MSREERLKKEAAAYMKQVAVEQPESNMCPECGMCWLWRSDMPCGRRDIMEAYIAGANRIIKL